MCITTIAIVAHQAQLICCLQLCETDRPSWQQLAVVGAGQNGLIAFSPDPVRIATEASRRKLANILCHSPMQCLCGTFEFATNCKCLQYGKSLSFSCMVSHDMLNIANEHAWHMLAYGSQEDTGRKSSQLAYSNSISDQSFHLSTNISYDRTDKLLAE